MTWHDMMRERPRKGKLHVHLYCTLYSTHLSGDISAVPDRIMHPHILFLKVYHLVWHAYSLPKISRHAMPFLSLGPSMHRRVAFIQEWGNPDRTELDGKVPLHSHSHGLILLFPFHIPNSLSLSPPLFLSSSLSPSIPHIHTPNPTPLPSRIDSDGDIEIGI